MEVMMEIDIKQFNELSFDDYDISSMQLDFTSKIFENIY